MFKKNFWETYGHIVDTSMILRKFLKKLVGNMWKVQKKFYKIKKKIEIKFEKFNPNLKKVGGKIDKILCFRFCERAKSLNPLHKGIWLCRNRQFCNGLE